MIYANFFGSKLRVECDWRNFFEKFDECKHGSRIKYWMPSDNDLDEVEFRINVETRVCLDLEPAVIAATLFTT